MVEHWRLGPVIASFMASAAAVVIMTVVEGSLLFHRTLSTVLGPPGCTISQLSLIDGDRTALVCFAVVSPLEKVPLTYFMGVYDLSSDQPTSEILCPEMKPYRVAGARCNSWIYVATDRGELYALDLQSRPRSPLYLGRHDCSHVALLECNEDGSLAIAAGLHVLMAWDREAQQLRWRRDDLIANCGAFVPRSKRFICGLENGEVLELDAVTGRTLRKLADHRRWVSELAVSPRGDYVASIDLDGRLVVSDLARGQVVWSLVLRRFVPGMSAGMIARPAFTSNGDALAVVDLAHGATIDFVRPVDGLVVNRLPVRGRIVKGLAVAKNETCYSWDFGGTIAVWHPGQSPAIRRFSPAPSWLAHASELTITRRL